jgi:acyl phosphate:glycerol-3-phosphate acyltransferase
MVISLNIIQILVFSYFGGAIPFSWIIAKINNVDLTKTGSGNIGATNVYRSVGHFWGFVAFFFDSLKGFVVALAVNSVSSGDPLITILGAVLSLVGHTLSPYVKFKGGKGVATGIGILFFIQPIVAIISLCFALLIIVITKYVSLASLSSGLLVFLLLFVPIFQVEKIYHIFVSVAVVYIFYKHKANIIRLFKGEENKI